MNRYPANSSVDDRASGAGADALPGSDDFLPPVEPPGAGFIMQLFLIPMIIVGIIVTVWLAFSWLAHMGTRPEELVRDFERLNGVTWQKALTLANMLRDPTSDALRRDPALARRLAAVLQRQLDAARTDQEHIWYRIYLCRALGEFQVTDGLPVLLRAADQEHAAEEAHVRRAALEAIGLLIDRVGAPRVQANEQVVPTLLRAAEQYGDQPDEKEVRSKLRSTAAFVLGLLEGDEVRQKLLALTSDPYPFARYNAATGLARQGDARAVARLVEMLDPNNAQLAEYDEDETEVQWNRTHVMGNALRATKQLVNRNPSADLSALQSAIQELMKTGLEGALRVEADEVHRLLADRRRDSTVPLP